MLSVLMLVLVEMGRLASIELRIPLRDSWKLPIRRVVASCSSWVEPSMEIEMKFSPSCLRRRRKDLSATGRCATAR